MRETVISIFSYEGLSPVDCSALAVTVPINYRYVIKMKLASIMTHVQENMMRNVAR